jgi:hypothetical protein
VEAGLQQITKLCPEALAFLVKATTAAQGSGLRMELEDVLAVAVEGLVPLEETQHSALLE